MHESSQLELKSVYAKSFLKTVSAYANFHDGEVIFGVDDNGHNIGLDSLEETALKIEHAINDAILPRPQFEIIKDQDTRTITLKVYRGHNGPYLYKGQAYRRSDTSTVAIDRLELNRLIILSENLSFDALPAPDTNLSFHVLETALKQQLGVNTFDEDILKTLGLLQRNQFNRAAALLADENNYPGIDIVVFGASINEIRDRITSEGSSLLTQLQVAMDSYERHLSIERIEGVVRTRVDLIPREAYREAVANALVHRTWDLNARIRISIFPDKVEISSPGGLPADLSEREYLNGRVSILRNPILADTFYRLGIIEKFGTGVIRIQAAYKEAQESPQFEVEAHSITVVLPVLGSTTELSKDEARMLRAMAYGKAYTRAELDQELGFEKSKSIRLINALIERGLVFADGNTRSRRYQRV
ncbi:putative DNA binding domain-containing protein [Collinsella sp. zg1085]|uniref:ATP-binding protein n=1 Tax=Collinsella sp. zg1085 TaxID=2844380 RepID=UPI001C0BA926|nr:ATP-binding protein [Collinsella sp. zg1085]QWT17554.1 putative DNA binding domain-containing protein [Collinsella sp. zg1085]